MEQQALGSDSLLHSGIPRHYLEPGLAYVVCLKGPGFVCTNSVERKHSQQLQTTLWLASIFPGFTQILKDRLWSSRRLPWRF